MPTPQSSLRNEAATHLFVGIAYTAAVSGVSLLLGMAPAWLLAGATLGSFIAFVFLWHLRFHGRISYADPAVFFLFVITLYNVIPLITFEYFDFNLAGGGDSRLNSIALDQGLIYRVWLCSNLAMAGFGGTYLALRKARMPRLEIPRGTTGALWAGLLGALAIVVLTFVYREVGDTYADEYLFYMSLPTFVAQLFNIVWAIFFVCSWGLFLAYVGSNKRNVASLILFLTMATLFLVTDARAGLVLLAGGFIITLDHFSKRISPITLTMAAAAGLAVFLLLGLVREGLFSVEDAAGRSEFMAVFVTALDIQQLYITGSTLDMNANLLVSDLLRLVPQQLLSWEKVDPATWYVSTFYPYYAQTGGGLAFGLVSESVLGGGPVAAFVRGLLLGAIVCLVLNFLTRRASFWRSVVYLWLFVSIYLCFRDTTFTLLGRFAFQYGPALMIVMVMRQLMMIPAGADYRPSVVHSSTSRRGSLS